MTKFKRGENGVQEEQEEEEEEEEEVEEITTKKKDIQYSIFLLLRRAGACNA